MFRNVGSRAIYPDDNWPANITHHVDPGLSVLRSAAIAPGRRETVWSNMRAAYLDLPLPLRKLVDDLWAVHGEEAAEAAGSGAAEANTKSPHEGFVQTNPEVDHPVVRSHPETGERILALRNFGGRFVGLQKNTSRKLFHLLQSYISAPENAVRWSWKLGDIAIWDNHATQHFWVDDRQKDAIRHDNLPCELSPSVNGHGHAQRSNPLKPEAARAA
ncbi:TauD/TfdA dioxygenase family protein [Bradyrhizobium sp. USDA 336]|uniref:TauD/TfdA dioxygenase family protein n=1 Tax=Bradyrhizobium sp. USDA 336 TaxID=3156311 RepID=UPI003833945D